MLIKHVYIDVLAHIKELEIEETDESGQTKFWMISKEDWLKQGYQADNITITYEGFKVKKEWYNNRIIRSIDSQEKLLNYNYKIKAVYWEEAVHNRHRLINKVKIQCDCIEAVQELTKLGGIAEQQSFEVSFESLQLVKLMINSADIRTFFYRNLIYLDEAYNIFIDITKEHKLKENGIQIIEDTTYKDQFNNWMKKVKILGLSDSYVVGRGYELSIMEIGDAKVLSFPKVRKLDRFLFLEQNLTVTEVIIPDTVKSIMCDFMYLENIEKIDFGVNCLTLYCDALYELYKLKELDLKNIIDIPTLNSGLNLERLRIRIDAKLEWTGINNVKTLKEIEFIEGE